jgi:transposase InsO family protein
MVSSAIAAAGHTDRLQRGQMKAAAAGAAVHDQVGLQRARGYVGPLPEGAHRHELTDRARCPALADRTGRQPLPLARQQPGAGHFNGRFRGECLNSHWFTSLADARHIIEAWRQDYNQVRPHSSLNYATPQEVYTHLTGTSTMMDAAGFSL